MAEFTDIELEFRINLSSPDFDIVRGIEVAMQIEEKGRRFYSEKSRSVGEPLRPFMKFLSEQEREHESTLGELKGALQSAKLWVKLPQSQVQEPVKNLAVFKKHPGNEYMDTPNDIHVLLEAMRMEKSTREFYAKLAETVKSQEGRAFFKSLADWEKKHYELLSGIYNASTYSRLET